MAIDTLEALDDLGRAGLVVALDQATYVNKGGQLVDGWEVAQQDFAEYGDVVDLAKVNSVADRPGLGIVVPRIRELGGLTMVDWKLNDVDDTVERRAMEATLAGASIVTVMACNSEKALMAAQTGVKKALELNPALTRPWLAGVTVLTSVTDKGEVCKSIFGANRATKVLQFGEFVARAGYDAVVCSAAESASLAANPVTRELKRIIPAIRPLYATKTDEQKASAVTPTVAIEAGADLLVEGRPINDAEEYGLTKREAAERNMEEIASARRRR